MTDLNELVAPHGVEHFLDAVWGRHAKVFPGPDDRFAELLPWSALNELLRRHRLETPRLRLARDGDRLPVESYSTTVTPRRGPAYARLDPVKLASTIADGSTLVIDSIDELHGPIDELAGDLERVLRERVQVNCYASFTRTHGFDTHWDDHDVLVVQVHGRKHWRLFGPTRRHPTHRDVEHPEPPTGEPELDVVLEAGDVLHMPRGCWHDANALDGPSLHLTFGINCATGVDFAAWAADELRRHEIARQNLPRFADEESKGQRVKELAELIAAEFADGDALERFFTDRDVTAVPRGGVAFPFSVTGELPEPSSEAAARLRFRLVVPRAILTEREKTVELAGDGNRYTFASAAAPVLRELISGEERALDHLVAASGGLSAGTVRTLCMDLIRRGLLTAN
ncbi:MAG: cupin domain-containing protein [Sciscionella sp.]